MSAGAQLNLPNLVTIFRIFLVPVLVAAILTRFQGKEWFCVGVFLLAASTDWLDGWLARRRKQVTPLGKLLDPMADKLLMSGAFISLIMYGVPPWMVVVVIAREFAVTGLRGIAAERGIAIAASPWGKIKMGVQVATIVVLLVTRPHAAPGPVDEMFHPFSTAMLWGTVLVTVASGVDYFVTFRRVLEQGPPEAAGMPSVPNPE